MASFLLSLTNPVTGLPDITVENNIVTVTDHSNYGDGTEAGHARANFTDFYKMKFVLPNGQTYLFSSKYPTDGDAIAGVPSAGDPTVAYTYETGDGQYWIHIYTAPTYSAGASYLIANTPYVWYASKYWKALQNTAGNAPAEGVYWTEITDIDLLPTKYRVAQRLVIYSDAKRTYARRIYNANVINNRIGENWEQLLKDPEFIAAVRLFISINSIPVSMAANNWTAVDATINFTKQVSSLYEVL